MRRKGDPFTLIYNILSDTHSRRHVLWGYVIYLRYKTEFQFSCLVTFHVACPERLENASEEQNANLTETHMGKLRDNDYLRDD